MIGKILKSTAGKPCSCPEGKICTACKKKKTVKPQVYIEEPRRLTIPIVISHYRPKPLTTATVQVSEKSRRWSFRKKEPVKKPVVRTTLCQWYKHQKERKRERQERIDRAKREREIEFLQQLRQDEYASIAKKESLVSKKGKPVKPKKVKARTATAKPQADSKFVSVKQYNRYDSLSIRFVNCCYKLCCQFYCCLSCIFIIGFVIIYFL